MEQAVLPLEVPGPPFLYFAAHHVKTPFLQAVQRHYVWRIASASAPPASQAVQETRGRVQVDDRKLLAIFNDVVRQPLGKNQFSPPGRDAAFNKNILKKSVLDLVPQLL